MKLASAVEHGGRREEEHRPLRPARVPSPERVHEPHSRLVRARHERHVDDTNNERRDGDDDGGDEAQEEGALLARVQDVCALL